MTRDELEDFNTRWLRAWTEKDIPTIASMYAADCSYKDGATAAGLSGRAALVAYLEKLFPAIPAWTYTPETLWPIEDGFCARWFLEMGGKTLRGFDFVRLRDGEIIENEVYTHNL